MLRNKASAPAQVTTALVSMTELNWAFISRLSVMTSLSGTCGSTATITRRKLWSIVCGSPDTRISRRAYLRPEVVLPVGQVEKRLRAIERIVQQRIFADANHLIWLVIQDQGTFRRRALRPQAARQRFVDDGHARRAGSV